MSFLRRLLVRSPAARDTAKASITASAVSTGNLPSKSAANSAGASTNLVEISENLDRILSGLTEDERLDIAQENVANRLRRVCDLYSESRIPDDLPQWNCNSDTIQLAALAAECSEAVYKRRQIQTPEPVTAVVDAGEFAASVDGSIRATLIQTHEASNTIVLSFRGTKATSPIDWLTNANGDAEDASEFLPNVASAKVHSGFLYVATAMAKTIPTVIQAYRNGFQQLLFTGHSAGGAVAALIFSHFKLTGTLGNLKLHCITFGAPPVYSPPTLTTTVSQDSNTTFLAFVNHGDPVTRSDKTYVKKLLEIYADPNPHIPIVFVPATLFNAGMTVLLYDENQDADEIAVSSSVVSPEKIGGLLFGNVKIHPMKEYLSLIGSLRQHHEDQRPR